ncbi:MAG: hypothetical protein AB7F89_15150 [Pirellulaceae bacterium]
MACVHLRRLFQLCQDEKLRLSGSDLIHIVCQQCGVQERCPSAFVGSMSDEDDADPSPAPTSPPADSSPPK